MLLELHCICNSHHRAVVGNKTSLEQHSDAKKNAWCCSLWSQFTQEGEVPQFKLLRTSGEALPFTHLEYREPGMQEQDAEELCPAGILKDCLKPTSFHKTSINSELLCP